MNKTFGFHKRLRALLSASGMSQEKVARHLGVSSSTMSRWVRGVRVPSAYQLRNLVHFFGLPYVWFLEDAWEENFGVSGEDLDSEENFDGLDEDLDGLDENLAGEEDYEAAKIAEKLGLKKDTVEELAALAETAGPNVLDAVDEAVCNIVFAVRDAYDDMLQAAEQSLRRMREDAKETGK